jgi:hemoglobin
MGSPRSYEKSVYESIGGADVVRQLVERFYGYMDQLPEARELRQLHPTSLDRSVDSLFKFFSGWFGGPPLYVAERGHPRLRMRHFPFVIGQRERDQWMQCMRLALADVVPDSNLRGSVDRACSAMADHMINA